jgi:hypothetical protein
MLEQEPDADTVRAMLAAEIDLLRAQRRGCPPGLLAGIDYYILMSEAARACGDVERARAALIAIRDSRRAGLLQKIPEAVAGAETGGRSDASEASTKIAFPDPP